MIETLHLFEEVDGLLLALLADLEPADWERPTIAGSWTVRQVAAHLLDTPLRRLSLARDGWMRTDVSIRSEADLRAVIDAANAEGVRVLGRLSPRVLIDLLALATRQLREHLASVDPHGAAAFPVSWAGQSDSPHWFDVAREYTERWHHQAQIRLAVGALPVLTTPRLYAPVLETFMQAVPYACRGLQTADGTCVAIAVEGVGGGRWTLVREAGRWCLWREGAGESIPARPRAAAVRIPADVAWRLFTKGLAPVDAAAACTVEGDAAMGVAVLATRAIVG